MATPQPTPEFDLNNIQGDILSGLPKKTETYMFFEIKDAAKFRKDLNKFIPLIKTVAGVIKDRQAIEDHKKNKHPGLVPMTGVNISFTHLGFTTMGIDDSSLRPAGANGAVDPFELGQKKDAVTSLGDVKKLNGDPDWEDAFLHDTIHGLILISGDSHANVDKKKAEIEAVFGVQTPHASITEVINIRGDVRPGDEAGHEHFGFLDGISNPAVIGFDTNPNPGPKPVNPGVIITGHNGDPNQTTRASWATDGSFLAFRYLFQKVPEFDEFLKKNPVPKDGNGNTLKPDDGSELLGARMVGRWKSGAPIDITPFKDDPALAADPKRNNDFEFTGEFDGNGQSQFKCPFAAHIRRTNPRDDLESRGFDVGPNRILRRGVQFGPEVTDHERRSRQTEHGRGLLFACYQSSLVNGFQFIQHSWANNASFPFFGTPPAGAVPGLDPIIGQNDVRQMTGLDSLNAQTVLGMPDFVVPRGGEYLFVPSLKGLQGTIATPA